MARSHRPIPEESKGPPSAKSFFEVRPHCGAEKRKWVPGKKVHTPDQFQNRVRKQTPSDKSFFVVGLKGERGPKKASGQDWTLVLVSEYCSE